MKNFNQIINEEALNVQDETMNYISATDLEKYLDKCKKFLSTQAKEVIQYMIDHNYVSELASKNDPKNVNVLKSFIENNRAHTQEQKKLASNIKFLAKKNRLLEIPVFLNQEQFEGIINGTINPDDILLDFSTENGRNEIAKMFTASNGRYAGILHKIVNSYMGKSKFSRDDLMSAALEGLNYAIAHYGKKSDKTKASDENIKQTTFWQFAAYCIKIFILESIKDDAHTVRIPRSQQAKERKEKGYNTKNTDISGDAAISSHSAKGEDGAKTVFDFIGDVADNADKDLDTQDSHKLWMELYKMIEKKFDKKTADIFYKVTGLKDNEPVKAIEVAKEYNIAPSNITYIKNQVIKYVKTDKKAFSLLQEIYAHFNESKHDREENDYDPLTVSVSAVSEAYNDKNNYNMFEDQSDDEVMTYKFQKWFGLGETNKADISEVLLNSIFSATDELQARTTINSILTNEDKLSQRYARIIKNFVNFMYDNVDESQEIEYADRIMKLSTLYKAAISSRIQEANENPGEILQNLINTNDEKHQASLILVRYYFNHQDNIDTDKDELQSTDISKSIKNLYKEVFGKPISNSVDGINELVKLVAENNIEFK